MKNADMPAMPVANSNGVTVRYGTNGMTADGLTKREAMAMAAMQGLCAQGGYHTREALAEDAVAYADALLAALEKWQ